jgi:hypothetical protein
MSGMIERLIREHVSPGDEFLTPSGRGKFSVRDLTSDGLVLLLGSGEHPATLRWLCLEGLGDFLDGRGWVRVGGSYLVTGEEGTLDGYLKGCTGTATAGWIAVVLEHAGVVELDRSRPAKVRLRVVWR